MLGKATRKVSLSQPFLYAPNASKNYGLRAMSPYDSRQSTGRMTNGPHFAHVQGGSCNFLSSGRGDLRVTQARLGKWAFCCPLSSLRKRRPKDLYRSKAASLRFTTARCFCHLASAQVCCLPLTTSGDMSADRRPRRPVVASPNNPYPPNLGGENCPPNLGGGLSKNLGVNSWCLFVKWDSVN